MPAASVNSTAKTCPILDTMDVEPLKVTDLAFLKKRLVSHIIGCAFESLFLAERPP